MPIHAVEGVPFSDLTVANFDSSGLSGNIGNFHATIFWGDQSSSAGFISPNGPDFLVTGSHLYAKQGIYPDSVVVTDDIGGSVTGLGTATVADAPVIVSGVPVAATANTPFSGVVATFTDTGADPASQYSAIINWGDGTTSAGTVAAKSGGPGYVVSGNHTYTASGTQPVSITVTNATNTSGTATTTATIADPAPVVHAQPITAQAGQSFSGSVAVFTDADPTLAADAFIASITWGDSTTSAGTIIAKPGGFDVSGTHKYAASGMFPTVVTVTRLHDNVSATSASVANVSSPAAPGPMITANPIAITPAAGLPFTGVVSTFTYSDSTAKPTDFTATIDWGGGLTPVITTGLVTYNAQGAGFSVSGTHTYDQPGAFPLVVTITHTADGATARTQGTATVSNATFNLAPSDFTAQALETFAQVVAKITDTNTSAQPGDYAIIINWGDGTTSIPTAVVQTAPGQFNVIGTHNYAQAGLDAVRVSVLRKATGELHAVTTNATVTAPLTLSGTGTTITPTVGIPFTEVVAMFNASPPASADRFAASIDWGDGTTSAGQIVPKTTGGFNVVGTHTYSSTTLPTTNSATSGTPKTITVKIVDLFSGSNVTTSSQISTTIISQAIVSPQPFRGGLDPQYDTGGSNTDGVTKINQPKFSGTALPFSLIQLYSQLSDQLGPVLLGRAIADADGSWSIFTGPLADGQYAITATVTPPSGGDLQSVALPSLTIDTVAPRVTGLRFDPHTRTVSIAFRDDRSGMGLGTLTDAGNYNLIRGVQRRYASTSSPRLSTIQIVPTDPQAAVVSLDAALFSRGLTTLRVLSGGVADLAGNALDGEYHGRFPSGNGKPGGDFITSLAPGHNVQRTHAAAVPRGARPFRSHRSGK